MLNKFGRLSPGHSGGKIHGYPFELGNAGGTFFDGEGVVIINGDERNGLLTGFVDVAALRHPRHDHHAIAGVLCTDMDMPQGPVVEAPAMKV